MLNSRVSWVVHTKFGLFNLNKNKKWAKNEPIFPQKRFQYHGENLGL